MSDKAYWTREEGKIEFEVRFGLDHDNWLITNHYIQNGDSLNINVGDLTAEQVEQAIVKAVTAFEKELQKGNGNMKDNHTILIENLKNRMSKDHLLGYALIGVERAISEVQLACAANNKAKGVVLTKLFEDRDTIYTALTINDETEKKDTEQPRWMPFDEGHWPEKSGNYDVIVEFTTKKTRKIRKLYYDALAEKWCEDIDFSIIDKNRRYIAWLSYGNIHMI